jgi:lysosomal acid lipase/cholesteryl ester hydrolase
MRLFELYLWFELIRIWIYVIASYLIVFFERIVRMAMLVTSFLIPVSLVDWFRFTRFPQLSMPRLVRGFNDPQDPKEITYDSVQLITSRGYPCEEHFVITPDGFHLCMHRISHGKLETPPAKSTTPRQAVFIMHGFLQCDESWLVLDKNLPFLLADAGYDVWLGNARGNKYSCKHERYKPDSQVYWDFCLDELARQDLPTSLNYILKHTGNKKLSYVGFSQGSAMAFASFSVHHDLAAKINIFVALAPAALATGFTNHFLDSLAKMSPEVVYLIFGRRAMLGFYCFWQNLLSTRAFVKILDLCLLFLFGWDVKNVTPEDKAVIYSHIYSPSSVKAVVHWFQLMRSKRFQVYDDHKSGSPNSTDCYAGVSVPCYPVSQITCPIAIFYGGRDFLPDTAYLLKTLPKHATATEEPSYEHMDFMYCRKNCSTIYLKVLDLLQRAIDENHSTPAPDEKKDQ